MLEIITKLEWIHILYFNLACINPSDGFQTLATNSLKPRIFSSNLLSVSQELFSNDYKKVSGINIFSNFRNFVAKYLFKDLYSLDNDTAFNNTLSYQTRSRDVQSYKCKQNLSQA